MPLRDKRYAGMFMFGQLRQHVGQCRAVLDGAEVPALARGESVADLVDRPQVDSGGVEGESVAVVQPGVLAEAVQEDHRSARIIGGPVPEVSAAAVVVEKGHVMTAPVRNADRKLTALRADSKPQLQQSMPG